MPKSESLNFTQKINIKGTSINASDASNMKTIYTGSGNDAVVKAVTVCSTDTTARNVIFYVNDGTSDYVLGSAYIPPGSGAAGSYSNIDILSVIQGLANDSYGKKILLLNSGSVLKVKSTTTITAGTQIDILCQIEEY